MLLICFYDKSNGKIKNLVRSQENESLVRHRALEGQKGVVVKCPKEVYNMHAREIRKNCRVKSESNGMVELEYAGRQ